MDVSINGGTPKSSILRTFPCKLSMWGCPHLWKPPNHVRRKGRHFCRFSIHLRSDKELQISPLGPAAVPSSVWLAEKSCGCCICLEEPVPFLAFHWDGSLEQLEMIGSSMVNLSCFFMIAVWMEMI